MSKLLILLFLPAIIFGFRGRLLDETCDPMNTSYAIYVIDAKAKPEKNCNYTVTFATGDCSYASPAFKPNATDNFCFNDSSLLCDGVDTSTIGGFVTKYCGDAISVEQFEPVKDYSFKKEFKIKSPSVEANVLVGSACRVDPESDPLNWPIEGLRTCSLPIAMESHTDVIVVDRHPHWGRGGRFYGRRYGSRCRGRGWRSCWRW
eukprot:TRINITY_DN7916_c0_g1_i5.p1 TRINITY_DN7916_c0_g1~~TRINITY_DN7916_c0_g1_i5.p1  ORF type:complete len:204 (-),score=41.00 TRINITY_DN7916_c0_g1_i5:942-1553(-)